MAFVIDSSCIVAWLLGESEMADRAGFGHRLRSDSPLVPPLFWLETANALVMGFRRGRIDRDDVDAFLDAISDLPIRQDREPTQQVWGEIVLLSLEHGLTVYDAAYLELARRTSSPLATLDGRLARAARADGVEVIGA